jgi:PKD repeat protein
MSNQAVDRQALPSVRRSSLGSSLAILALLGAALAGFWTPHATAQLAPQQTPCSFPYDGEWVLYRDVHMTCQGTAQTPLEIFVRNLTLWPASSLVMQHVHLVLNAVQDATPTTAASSIVLTGSATATSLDGQRLIIQDSVVEPENPQHRPKLQVYGGGDLTIRRSTVHDFALFYFAPSAVHALLEDSRFSNVHVWAYQTPAGIVTIRNNFFEGPPPSENSVINADGSSLSVTGNTFTKCGLAFDIRDFGQAMPEIRDNTFGGCNAAISQLYGDTPQEVHNNDFIDNWNRFYPDPSLASAQGAYTQGVFTGDATNNYWESHSPGTPEKVRARQNPGYEFDAATTLPSLTAPAHPERLPRPALAATPSWVARGQTVAFDGSASLPSLGFGFPLEFFAWGFGDGSTATGSMASHAYTVPGTFAVKLIVTDSKGLTRSLTRTIEVPNEVPVLESLSIQPANPVAGTTLLTVSSATDPDGDALSYGYAWTRNGILQSDLTGASVPGSRVRSLDSWAVTVTASDSYNGQDTTSASVGIPNGSPALRVELQPTDPLQGQALQAVATASDPDQDNFTLTYAWSKNGALQGDLTATTVPGTRIQTGDAWTVTVKARDTHGAETLASKAVTVGNRAPTLTGLTLTPAAPTRSDSLRIVPTATDADGQAVSYRFAWTRNGATQGELTTDKVPQGLLVKGDVWRVTVTPTDGYSDGSSFETSVVIQNTAPILESATATNVQVQVGRSVALRAEGRDPDGDPLNYTWMLDGANPLLGQEQTRVFDQPGNYKFRVTASDGTATTAERILVIGVTTPLAVEQPPSPAQAPSPEDEAPTSTDPPEVSEESPVEQMQQEQPSGIDVEAEAEGAEAIPAPFLAFVCLLAAGLARRRRS